MAEALWRDYVAANDPQGEWDIASAGTWTGKGRGAMPLTLQVLGEQGLDMRGHRSQPVDWPLIYQYRLILVMEQGHKEALHAEFPQARDRIFLLSEMSGPGYSVADPVRGGLADYRHTLAEIADLLVRGAECIQTLARVPAG
jgi:protein-tyrosine phosphatase